MKIKTKSNLYYLKGILDHKEKHQLTPDIELTIVKDYENNLRQRNPQLGIVMAMPEDNHLELVIGDYVVVHHLVFCGDIGPDRAYEEKPHIIFEGEKLFPCEGNRIFFKYKDKIPVPVGDYILAKTIETDETKGGLYMGKSVMSNECEVTFGNCGVNAGDRLLVTNKGMYEIIIDKVVYQRVLKQDACAVIKNGVAELINNYIMGIDLPQEETDQLVYTGKAPKTVKTEIVKVGPDVTGIKIGDIAYRNPVGGIKREGFVFLNDDNIHFYLTDEE